MRITQEEELMKSACERWNLKKEMVPKPSPTPFSAPFVSWFRVERSRKQTKDSAFQKIVNYR